MKTTKKIVLAAIAGTALLAASGAQAKDDHWDHGYRGHYHRHFAPYRVVVRPAPVYYAPAAVYYPPQPVYYAPPRPVIYGAVPVNPNLNIGFRVRF
jgi:hypothetical protein